MNTNKILSALGFKNSFSHKIVKVTALTISTLIATPSFAHWVCIDTYVIVNGIWTYAPFCYDDAVGGGSAADGYPGSGGDQSAEDDYWDTTCPDGFEFDNDQGSCFPI